MPKRAYNETLESRTQPVNKKRTPANTSNSNRPRKRRRNVVDHTTRDFGSTDNSFSPLTSLPNSKTPSPPTNGNPIADYHTNQLADSIPGATESMANADLGRNRLAMGFTRPQIKKENVSNNTSTVEVKNTTGRSSVSPIEISDDEMDSEGGMVINIDQSHTSPQAASDDEGSQESGEIASTPKNHPISRSDTADLFVVDSNPTLPLKRLADLSSDELNDQLKYAFYHLDRDQIDLSRPVMCLACSVEGHLHQDCKVGSDDAFYMRVPDIDTQVKLWISCCICASKTHLVGDCPHLQDRQAVRWSLEALNAKQILNLSLQTGTRKAENEAENRGVRPAGLQIKGRAGLHHAGVSHHRSSSDDEDEPFLRKPIVNRRGGDFRPDFAPPQRYNRYDPPSNQPSYRGGGEWYATDSFGRQRSRSPADRYESYRPGDRYDRSRRSPQRDSWRPPPPYEGHEPYGSRMRSPPRNSRAPASSRPSANGPGPNIQISLPTRKGSNTWSQGGQGGSSMPQSDGKPRSLQHPKKKNKANKKRGPPNGKPA